MKNLKPITGIHFEWFKEWMEGATHEEVAEKFGVTIYAVQQASSRERWSVRRDSKKAADYDKFMVSSKGSYQTLIEAMVEDAMAERDAMRAIGKFQTKEQKAHMATVAALLHKGIMDTQADKGNLPELPAELRDVVQMAMPKETAEALGMFIKKRKPIVMTHTDYEEIKEAARPEDGSSNDDEPS